MRRLLLLLVPLLLGLLAAVLQSVRAPLGDDEVVGGVVEHGAGRTGLALALVAGEGVRAVEGWT